METSWIARKGAILEKGGGMTPLPTMVYLHQAIMGKSNQTIEKTHNYPSVPKSSLVNSTSLVYSTSCNGIGGCKKEEKISKSKTTTLTYLDSLKKKQQDQGAKNWCCTEHFLSLTISNLRTTVFCFENKF